MKPDEMPSTNISKLWISNNQKDWLDAGILLEQCKSRRIKSIISNR
ncbi:hypothetical protein [Sedimentibacter sp. LTW-03]